MKFPVQSYVSPFIRNQFPQFYNSRGPNFIAFVQAYYEFLEQETQAVGAGRQLYNYRDIDNTLDQFLVHFQKKYLYGIPFSVVINLRFLLKHVLDVYRSKGSPQGYDLLFRLIYDVDSSVYLPAVDILKASDGTWVQPAYLEVADTPGLGEWVGWGIVGTTSGTTAVVEDYVVQPINGNLINVLYLSNVQPPGAQFTPGEKIDVSTTGASAQLPQSASTTLIGSLYDVSIVYSSGGFNAGDVLAVAHVDPLSGDVTQGTGGKLRITDVGFGLGEVLLTVVGQGYGFMTNATCFLYRGPLDTTGVGAAFSVSGLAFPQLVSYNTDVLYDYASVALNASTYGFPGNTSANLSTAMTPTLTYHSNTFGGVATLNVSTAGRYYTQTPIALVRSTINSHAMPGAVSYTASSNTVTLSGGAVDATVYFTNTDVIMLQANSSNASTVEVQAISSVTNSTTIVLYGPPSHSSTASAKYYLAPSIFPSNFALYEPIMFQSNGSVDGLNADIDAASNFGSNIAIGALALDSGRGYVEGETIHAYLYGSITQPLVVSGGTGYANGDSLVFSGASVTPAQGYVTTNSTGGVTSTTLTNTGAGITVVPNLTVQSNTGSGAVLQTTLTDFNTSFELIGTAHINGLGVAPGYWTTTKGFLNSNKYLQDNYYYQDFSYELQAPIQPTSYEGIFQDTVHTSGALGFGKYLLTDAAPGAAGGAVVGETVTIE